MKTIVVTGGNGFLGRHLVERLMRGDDRVHAPSLSDYNLVEPLAARRMIYDLSPDVIVHLAAVVGGIGENRRNPARFFYENAMMGIQLLHQAWLSRVPRVLAVATICAYPKHAKVPFREEEIWDGYPEESSAGYGLAKKMLTVQAQAYREQYGTDFSVVYPTNLYGPGDNFDLESSHVIPALLRKFERGKRSGGPVTLWGTGKATRDFLYVEDCAKALDLAIEGYHSSEPMNLGSGWEISMRDLAQTIAKIVGYDGEVIWDESMPDGQPRRLLDVSRAMKELNWSSTTALEVGLARTYLWMRENVQI